MCVYSKLKGKLEKYLSFRTNEGMHSLFSPTAYPKFSLTEGKEVLLQGKAPTANTGKHSTESLEVRARV